MMKMKKSTKIILSVLILIAAVAALWFLDANKNQYSYAISILQRSAIYAIAAVAMNMLTGFTGLFSL